MKNRLCKLRLDTEEESSLLSRHNNKISKMKQNNWKNMKSAAMTWDTVSSGLISMQL